jgi:Restriction endonuclease S subunits
MELTKCKLGELITQRREKNDGSDLPICGVSKDGLIPPKQKDADTSIYNVFYRDDFIFNPARMELNSIAINDMYDRAICSSLYEVFYVHRTDLLLPHYLELIIRQKWFTRYCEFLGQGSAREYCRFGNISEIEIEFPPIEEQQKIVEYNTAIENRIALKQKINDNLANTEQAILVETVINNHTVPTALGDLVDFIDGDRGKNYPTFDEFTSTGYCLFLNASNVTSTGFNFDNCMFVSEEKDKLMNKGHLSPYDIVLTSRGTLGNVALYDKHIKYENVRINSGMLIIRPKTKRLSPYFIYALLKSSYMKAAIERFKSGSAQPQLPIKDLQKITFEIPESDTVLVALDRQFLAVEESISINNNEIGNLKELSNVLLAELSR